jgi:hypothetical protein
LAGNHEPNNETMSHLFQDCNAVSELLDRFSTILTGQNDFAFSGREFFSILTKRIRALQKIGF